MKNNNIFICFLLSTVLLSANNVIVLPNLQKKKSDAAHIEKKTNSCAIELYADCAAVKLETQISVSPHHNIKSLPAFPKEMRDDSFHIVLDKESLSSIDMKDFSIHQNAEQKDINLSLDSQSDVVQKVHANITYTTEGLSWKPFYTADLSSDCKTINLNCWFTVQNDTNTLFENAHLALFDKDSGFRQIDEMRSSFDIRENNVFSIDRPVSILPKQQKRIMWLQETNIPLKKEYVLSLGGIFLTDMTDSDTIPKVDTQLSWNNTFKNLPLAPITIYQESEETRKSPLMQTTFNKTALDMPVSFRMPAHLQNNSDQPIQVSYEQTEFQKFTSKLTETANRLTLKNVKNDPVTVKVCVSFPVKNGMIVRDNIAHKTDGNKKRYWIFNINPGEKIDLKYRARITTN